MEYKNADHILSELKQGQVRPVYLLHGEESFFIDEISDYIEEKLLTDGEKAFNQVVLYGRDADYRGLIDEARQFPMMSQKRVVIVKEAQDMKDLKELGPYITSPSDMTVLVLAHKNKKIDGRISWVKDAKKSPKVAMLASDPIREYQIPAWITQYLKAKKRSIDPAANQLMAEYIGADLKKMVNELAKVELNVPANQTINLEHIEKYVGISKEYNIFNLIKYLGVRDASNTHRILKNLTDNIHKNAVQMMIPAMLNHFQRVHITLQKGRVSDANLAGILKVSPYYVKDYKESAKYYSDHQLREVFKLLKHADAQSKGVDWRGGETEELFKELVERILMI